MKKNYSKYVQVEDQCATSEQRASQRSMKRGSKGQHPGGKGDKRMTVVSSNKSRCPSSGKVRYRDRREAVKALQRAKVAGRIELEMFGRSKRQEARIYKCPICNGFHLTSKPEQVSQKNYGKVA